MTNDSQNDKPRLWMIVSWRHIDHFDGAYGKLLTTILGTHEEAREEACRWVRLHAPIGIVEAIV